MSQLLKTLNEQSGAKQEKALTITSKAESEKRGFTEDERTEIRAINAEIRDINDSIQLESERISNATGIRPALSNGEARDFSKYSLARAVRCLISGAPVDGLEGELHQEAQREARAGGIALRGSFAIPAVFTTAKENRDMTATGTTTVTGDQGGQLIQTTLGSFIELLYSKMVLRGLGAQFLTGLQGNFALPKMLTGTTPTKKAENAAFDESSPTVGQVTFSPKRVGGFVEYSKQLLMQENGYGIENLLRNDLATQIALAMELGVINGGGTNEPTGILNAAASVAGGTNGLAPTLDHLIALQTAVALLNADVGSMGYLTNVAVRGKLMRTPIEAGTSAERIWSFNQNNMLAGYNVAITNQVPSNLTKGTASGVCSAIIFGNFADLVVAQWGGVDIQVNPYIKDTEGLVRITADAYYDSGIRRAASFATMKDALTV